MLKLKEKLSCYSDDLELLKMFRNGVENELQVLHKQLESIKTGILEGKYPSEEGIDVEKQLEKHRFECDRGDFDEILPLLNGLNIPVDTIPSYSFEIYEDEEYQETIYLYDYNDVIKVFEQMDDYMYFVSMIYIVQNMERSMLWHGVSLRVKKVLRQLNIKIPNYGMTVFIAMSFDDELKKLREVMIDTIKENGFRPVIIDSKEHNNQIVPEIFYEIDKAEFVVADLTHHKAGVYYEAGYAKGANKQVIFTCRKKDFKKRHFDVAQTNTIVWEHEYELSSKLTSRIEAMYLIES